MVGCCVRGHHVYKEVWTALIGEELKHTRGPENATDRYAATFTKNEELVGHQWRKLLKNYYSILNF